jgi:WS/DGAT/MGAT family acyltransferase
VNGERLNGVETAYLHAERAGYPIHVGSVGTFEAGPLLDGAGRLRLDDLRALVDARIDALPRMRQRVVFPPLDVDRPHWEDDPHFDVAHHVDVVDAPAPGDDAALRDVAAATWSELLDRSRPLWHMRFVTGLDAGRVALVERTHHAMVDGISGVDVAAVLLDASPDAAVPVGHAWTPAPPGTAPALAVDGLRANAREWAGVVSGAASTLVHPSMLGSAARRLGDVAGTLVADGLAPRSSLNESTGPDRQLAWVRARLDQVRAAGADRGATANDVLLAAVAGGVRHLLIARGEPVDEHTALHVLVPVSIRSADQRGMLGNRVTGLVVRLPIGIADPGQRLDAVAAETARHKAGSEGRATTTLLDALDHVPAALVRWIAPVVHHQPLVNLVVTNVPGPDLPLYLLGARMLEAFPIVPLVGNLSVGVAVLSYAGALNVGLTADRATCPDLGVLVEGIETSLHRLCAGSGSHLTTGGSRP